MYAHIRAGHYQQLSRQRDNVERLKNCQICAPPVNFQGGRGGGNPGEECVECQEVTCEGCPCSILY